MTITHHGTHVEWTKVPENFKASDGRVPFILSNKRNYYKMNKADFVNKMEK